MTGTDICGKDNCTGCFACANICPKECISMKADKSGHIFPKIDSSACIDCKLCKKICPCNNELKFKYPIKAFAGWHNIKSDYLSSTSGGAATALAQTMIDIGGVVYGCESDSQLTIKHVRITDKHDLYRLKGSKYVQSNIGHVFRNIQADLQSGRKVLFIGTPCQVAGLKTYLRKEYDDLYCVDLICHGVPSQVQLRKHVIHVAGSDADSVTFRQGNDMGLGIYDKNNTMLYYSNVWQNPLQDSYYGAFFNGYSYRISCYKCKYARPERISDITIGDFWGLSEEVERDVKNGTSCVLPITQKGLNLVGMSNIRVIERPVEEAINGNSQLRHPSERNKRAKVFAVLYKLCGYEIAYRTCEFDRIIKQRIIRPIRKKVNI